MFEDKNKFCEKVKSEVTTDKNGNVSVDQLRDFVLGICE